METDLSDVPVLGTLEEAAKWLRLSKRKVWAMGNEGLIRIVRLGRSVRYYIREFIEKGMRSHGHS